MVYDHNGTEPYLLNLVDTPGHVDFSSELLRSLLSCQGAVLLVDAGQGIQAQTLSVLDEALNRGLTVVGAGTFPQSTCGRQKLVRVPDPTCCIPAAVNKWDLVKDDGRGEAAVEELSDLLGCDPSEILRISAKTGWGVESVLEAIVERIPPPPPSAPKKENLRALAFDSWYDSFRGVVSLVSIHEGELRKGKVSHHFLFRSPKTAAQSFSQMLLLTSLFALLQATRSRLQRPARPTQCSISASCPPAN